MDSAWFGGEFIPSVAASIDDGIVAFEDAVAEPVLAQVLPDILPAVGHGGSGGGGVLILRSAPEKIAVGPFSLVAPTPGS